MSYKTRELNPYNPIHITARSNNRERFPMPLDETWDLFNDYLYFCSKCFELKIHSFVLMPNHFHLIASDPTLQMPKSMNYFMRETSKLTGRETRSINRMWGGPYHSSVIHDPLYFLHAYKYVYRNPVEAGLAECPTDYRFSTLGSLIGLERTILPLEEDNTLFDNVEPTLEWLRRRSPEEERDLIRKALRRKIFKIPNDPKTKKPSHLSLSDSVPKFLQHRVPNL